MFTGLIEETGRVVGLVSKEGGSLLRLDLDLDLERGESVAVNGVCLTMIPCSRNGVFEAALSAETLARTTLGSLKPGTLVNLERSLAVGDRLGGHLVQGHVDATGTLLEKDSSGSFSVFRWSFPAESADLIIDKGSIAVDGISLTVIEPQEDSFGVALIPETLERTNLAEAEVGAEVNLEYDMMAKYARELFLRYLEH